MRYLATLLLTVLLVACGTPGAGQPTTPPSPVAMPVPTDELATRAPTEQPTDAPAATIEPTSTAVATAAPEPTDAPVATEAPDTPAARYIAIAQAGVTIPAVRPGDMPKGEWKADVVDLGKGPEVTMTMPVGIGLSTAQMLRQAKRQVAQAIKAIFDADSSVARVSVTGTLPDGANNTELGAVSIFVTRVTYTRWDGIAENLGDWRIPPRYQ